MHQFYAKDVKKSSGFGQIFDRQIIGGKINVSEVVELVLIINKD
jgi:hypothetical protein